MCEIIAILNNSNNKLYISKNNINKLKSKINSRNHWVVVKYTCFEVKKTLGWMS